MVSGVALYGGFPDTGDPAWNDRDPNTYDTLLSGDIGTTGAKGDNCYHVFHHPSDINLKISDTVRRYITNKKKKIEITGPVFVGIRAELVG